VAGASGSGLHRALGGVIDVCEETLDAYAESRPDIASSKFGGVVLLAVAAFETVIATRADDPRRSLSLMIAATLGRDAAAALRGHVLAFQPPEHDVPGGHADDNLLRCAEACERGATLCEQALGEWDDKLALD